MWCSISVLVSDRGIPSLGEEPSSMVPLDMDSQPSILAIPLVTLGAVMSLMPKRDLRGLFT